MAQTTGFISRTGTELFLDGQPFTFTGLNIYNANSDGTCGSDIDFDQALTDIGPGKSVMRAWFFQNMATTAGLRDWTWFDETLATAEAHGVKVIPVLANQWNDCDEGYGFKNKTWYQTGYQSVDPAGTVSYRDWVAEIVTRYGNNPTVGFWQLINEAEIQDVESGDCSQVLSPADTLRTWAGDVAGLIKSIDSNHLVSLGTIGGGQCGTQGSDYEYVHSLGEVDLCEYHDYGDPSNPIPGDEFNGFQVRIDQCGELGKPLFVGEAGIIPNDVGDTLQDRADAFTAKLDAQFTAGAVGFLAWAFTGGPSTLDNYDIGPGDPVLNVLDLSVADLGVIKADSPDPVTMGSSLTYTFTVTNSGPDSATEVTLTDTLPSSMTFVSATSSQGTCSGTATVSCTLGTLGFGAEATVTIVVTPIAPGDITNTASVSAATTDPAPTNNTAETVTTVYPACTIIGTARNDALTGTSAADVICGLGGNDRLSGVGGNDTLLGGNGNDTLDGGPGANTLDGGAGTDTAEYPKAASGVTANLATGAASGPSTDTLKSIEDLGGSKLADSLTGGSGNNDLKGGGGNDFLDGGPGTDLLEGGAGTDTCVNGEKVKACEGTGLQLLPAWQASGWVLL